MTEHISQIQELEEKIKLLINSINLSEIEEKINNLKTQSLKPDFWNDNEKATKVFQELKELEKEHKLVNYLKSEPQNLISLCHDIDFVKDAESEEEIKEMIITLEETYNSFRIKKCFTGEYDKNNAYLEIHTGTGGNDAADFSNILMRMYMRFAENMDFKIEIVNKNELDDGGLKSATVKLSGVYAYGYLKHEAGIHRLIRLSPFNSGKTRETSFSAITVYPELENLNEFKVKDEDLKIDTFRASKKGGQGVNTTDSAVRLTHIPTGLTVSCQNERSQHQNKDTALKILMAKLELLKAEFKKDSIDELKGLRKEISWGNQIRTYTLHPYKLVKDHRTNYEETNVEKVFDGNIKNFIEQVIQNN